MLSGTVVHAESFKIDKFSLQMTVFNDGSVWNQETIDVRFLESSRGIYRILPRVEWVGDVLTSLDIIGISASRNFYIQTNTSTYKIITQSRTRIEGKQQYRFVYYISNMVSFERDYDEIYWNITGNNWDTTVSTTHFELILPKDIGSYTNIYYRMFIGVVGSTAVIGTSDDKALVYNTGGTLFMKNRTVTGDILLRGVEPVIVSNRVIFDIPVRLKPQEGITIQIRFDKGVIRPRFALFDPLKGWKSLFLNFYFITGLLVFIITFVFWLDWGRDKPKGTITTEFFPPDGVTPSEAYSILKQKAILDIPITIVDLAVRGYLTMGMDGYEFYVIQKKKDYEGLDAYEKELLTGLFVNTVADSDIAKNDNKVYLSNIKNTFYSYYKSTVACFEKEFYGKEFFVPKSFIYTRKFKKIAKFIIWTFSILFLILLLILSNNIAAFIKFYIYIGFLVANFLVFAKIMPQKTDKGHEIYVRIFGFKEFIKRADMEVLKTILAENPTYYDDILPYAMIFGLEVIWSEKFDELSVKPPEWFANFTLSGDIYHSMTMLSRLTDVVSQVREYTTTAQNYRTQPLYSSSIQYYSSNSNGNVKSAPDFETREKGSSDHDYGFKMNQSPNDYSDKSKGSSEHDYGSKATQSPTEYSYHNKGSSDHDYGSKSSQSSHEYSGGSKGGGWGGSSGSGWGSSPPKSSGSGFGGSSGGGKSGGSFGGGSPKGGGGKGK